MMDRGPGRSNANDRTVAGRLPKALKAGEGEFIAVAVAKFRRPAVISDPGWTGIFRGAPLGPFAGGRPLRRLNLLGHPVTRPPVAANCQTSRSQRSSRLTSEWRGRPE